MTDGFTIGPIPMLDGRFFLKFCKVTLANDLATLALLKSMADVYLKDLGEYDDIHRVCTKRINESLSVLEYIDQVSKNMERQVAEFELEQDDGEMQ